MIVIGGLLFFLAPKRDKRARLFATIKTRGHCWIHNILARNIDTPLDDL
jgi:hypothetical protein